MRLSVPLLAAALFVAACDQNPVDSQPTETSFAFGYRLGENAWQGFAADGQQPEGTSFSTPGEWVFTGSGSPNYATLLVSAYQLSGGEWQSLVMYVPNRSGVDSLSIGDLASNTCPTQDGSLCTQAFLRRESAAGALLEVCNVSNGTLVITRRNTDWISGRFSGTGTCRAGTVTRAFAMRDGTFDIALPPPAAGPG